MHFQYRYKLFRADECLYQMHLQNGRQESQVDQKVKQRLCNYYFCIFRGEASKNRTSHVDLKGKEFVWFSVSAS